MLKKPSRFIIVDDNTIKDSSDETEFVRSRKRPRREDSDELSPPASQTHPDAFKCRKPASDIDHKTRPSLKSDHDGTQILIHDPQYYFRDDKEADCFIRVEKILFKVHRDKLFMSKLMEKRITGRPEPTTGQDPLELFGVSVIEFRALMWARYATEDEAEGQPRALEDLERLLSLSTVTKNCGFDRLHEWSITSIHRAFTSNSSLVDSCSSAILTRVIEVAAQYKAADLLDAVVNKWCERIQRKDSPSVPAILAADEHKLEKLGGVAYYAHLLEAIAQAPPPKTNDTPLRIQADPKLNSKQLLRLLSGHVSLVHFTERYKRLPPKLACVESSCSNDAHKACVLVWNERWGVAAGSRKVLALCSADVLGLVGEMTERLSTDSELAEGVTDACRLRGLQSMKQTLIDIPKTFPQYFLGCL